MQTPAPQTCGSYVCLLFSENSFAYFKRVKKRGNHRRLRTQAEGEYLEIGEALDRISFLHNKKK